MKRTILTAFMGTCLFLAFSFTGQAQKKITKKVYAKTVEVGRGQNPNIKSEAPTIDEPENESRGPGSCNIKLANYTGYYINVYVDGYYRGQLSPWGGGTLVVPNGYTSIYCITAGKTLEWTEAGNCKDVYTFKLYP